MIDDEARQLDGDRKTVEALRTSGDSLTKARKVDHWIFFATPEARDRFIARVVPLGFTADKDTDAQGTDKRPLCVRVSRVDHVDLDSIHGVVMTLFEAAKREYDGWECPVETE
jgi:hypothetical protein